MSCRIPARDRDHTACGRPRSRSLLRRAKERAPARDRTKDSDPRELLLIRAEAPHTGARSHAGNSELGVFLAVATCFVHRVFCGIELYFLGRCGCQIDIELVSQSDEVEQDVGKLLTNFSPLLRR